MGNREDDGLRTAGEWKADEDPGRTGAGSRGIAGRGGSVGETASRELGRLRKFGRRGAAWRGAGAQSTTGVLRRKGFDSPSLPTPFL